MAQFINEWLHHKTNTDLSTRMCKGRCAARRQGTDFRRSGDVDSCMFEFDAGRLCRTGQSTRPTHPTMTSPRALQKKERNLQYFFPAILGAFSSQRNNPANVSLTNN
jgi:hypothetical protein